MIAYLRIMRATYLNRVRVLTFVPSRNKQLLTAEERILVHLYDYSKYREDYEVPAEVTQEEIGISTGILKNHVSRDMKRLMNKGFVEERLAKVRSLQRKRKAYFLTAKGLTIAQRVISSLSEKRIKLRDGDKTFDITLGEVPRQLSATHSLLHIARHVTDDVLYASELASAPPPPNLEKKKRDCISHFVYYPGKQNMLGRAHELALLKDFIESDQKVAQLYGMAGVGKTTLVSSFIEGCVDAKDIFWLGAHEWDTPKSVCAAISDFLSKCGRKRLSSFLSTQDRPELPRVIALICEEVANLSTIMVFDDVHKLNDDVRAMLSMLVDLATASDAETTERVQGLKVIFISRVLLPLYGRQKVALEKRIIELSLGGLDRESAYALFKTASRHADFDKVYSASGGHPLAVQLMEGEVNSFVRMEILSRLGAREKRILGLMCVFRIPIPPDAVCEDQSDREALDSLLSSNLLKEDLEGNLVMHELLQDFFHSRLGKSDRAHAHDFASLYHLSKNTVRDSVEALHHKIKGEFYDQACKLLIEIFPNAVKEGYLKELFGYIIELEGKVLDSDMLSHIIKSRGDILMIWSEWRDALPCYTKALNILQMNFSSRAITTKERGAMIGQLYECIGTAHRNLDEYDRAKKYFENALASYMQAEESKGIASARRNLGATYEALGKIEEALESYNTSLDILERLNDESGIAETCNRMGILYNDELGDALKARSYFERSRAIYEMAKDTYRLAGVLANIGETYRHGADTAWSIVKEMNMKALKIYDKYGDKQGAGVTYVNLGDVYCQQGEYDRAVDYLTRAMKIAEKIGDNELQAEAYRGLGLSLFMQDRPRALEYIKRSVEIFEKIGMPNKAAKTRGLIIQADTTDISG